MNWFIDELKRLEELYKDTYKIKWPYLWFEGRDYGPRRIGPRRLYRCSYRDKIYLNLRLDEIEKMICSLKKEKLIVEKNLRGAIFTVMLSINQLSKFDGTYGPEGELKRFVSTVEKEAERRGCNTVMFNVRGEIGDFYKGEEGKYWTHPFAG